MIKIIVFILVIASTLKQTKCNTTRETISTTPEKITADTEKIKADIEKLKEYTEKIKEDTENFKSDVKESLKKAQEKEDEKAKPVEESSSAENMTYVASNETENSKDVKDTKRVFLDGIGTDDAIPRTSPKLHFPLVTMDGESHNKTAELIRMVNEAEVVSHDVKKPNQVKYSQGVFKDKSKAMLSAYPLAAMDDDSHSRTAALIRTVNEANVVSHNDKPSKTQVNSRINRQHFSKGLRRLNIFDNFQPELDRGTPDVTNDMHKEERRYIIRNFDVIESYINNRRHSHLVPLRRKSKNNEDSTSSESNSDGIILRNNDEDIDELLNKVNYDEKDDDYVETETSKRNVWDYEHEDWAVTKKLDWSDVHSSKEAGKKKPRKSKIDNIGRSSHQKKHKTKTKPQDTAVTEDCSNKDIIVKVKTILKDDDKPKTESENNNSVKTKSNYHNFSDNDPNEKEVKRHRSQQSEQSDSERPKKKKKSSKKKRGHHDRKKSHEKSDDLKIDRKYRADRSNKSPTLTDSGEMPKRSRTEKNIDKKKISAILYNSDNMSEHLNNKDRPDKSKIHERAVKKEIDTFYKPERSQEQSRPKELDEQDYLDILEKTEKSKKSKRFNIQDRSEQPRSNDKLNVGSKEILDEHEDESFKKPSTNDKHSVDTSWKEKGNRNKADYDFKDNNDYHSSKKKSYNYDDKKLNDDYKNSKDSIKDHKDYKMPSIGRTDQESNTNDRWKDNHDKGIDKIKVKSTDYSFEKDYNAPRANEKRSHMYNEDESQKVASKDLTNKESNANDKWLDDFNERNKKSKTTPSDYGGFNIDYDSPKKKSKPSQYNEDLEDTRQVSNINDRWPEKQDEKSKSKHTDYGGFDKNYDAPKSKAKKSEDALKDIKQAYRNSREKSDKDLNKNRDQDDWNPHANNNWDKVGLDSDTKKDTTRRTTEYYNKDYNYKKQTTDYNDIKQTTYKIDKAPSWDKHKSNNNWDTVGIEKKSDSQREYRYQPPAIPYIAPSVDRPRSKNRKVEKNSNAFGYVRTPLPFRERKSVFDDD